jgi:iron complex transport system ATP-binding protein
MSVLSTYNLSIGYSKKKKKSIVQSNLNLKLAAGELVCLIGPNGSGKSTLLRTLAGLQKPLTGEIKVDETNIEKISQHSKALLLALVLTERVEIDNATVFDIVSFGRHPFRSWWGNISKDDEQKVLEAIQLVHLEHKKDSFFCELSDGERQRVMIAKALAQDTPIIILDEPTAHLDLPNRVEIMLLLHKLAHKTDKAILLSTHELDIALQAADVIWLINNYLGLKCGVPEDLVLDGDFNRTFENKYYFFNAANGNFSMNYPLTQKVSVEGDKTRMYWTLRALARAGFEVIPDADIRIEVTEKDWIVDDKILSSVDELLSELRRME